MLLKSGEVHFIDFLQYPNTRSASFTDDSTAGSAGPDASSVRSGSVRLTIHIGGQAVQPNRIFPEPRRISERVSSYGSSPPPGAIPQCRVTFDGRGQNKG